MSQAREHRTVGEKFGAVYSTAFRQFRSRAASLKVSHPMPQMVTMETMLEAQAMGTGMDALVDAVVQQLIVVQAMKASKESMV